MDMAIMSTDILVTAMTGTDIIMDTPTKRVTALPLIVEQRRS